MTVLLTERISNKIHIKYFRFVESKTSVLCGKYILNAYANIYATSVPIHLICKKCLSMLFRYKNENFRHTIGNHNNNIVNNCILRDDVENKMFEALDCIKISKYKRKLLKINKYK